MPLHDNQRPAASRRRRLALGSRARCTWIRPRRLPVETGEDDEVAIRIPQPELAMRRSPRAIGRVPVRWPDHVGVERCCPIDRLVEVVDLEPERHTVAVWSRRRVADLAVVVVDVEAVQLESECPAMEQALVLLPTVSALAVEQLLVPATAARDVGDRDQRLRTQCQPQPVGANSRSGLGCWGSYARARSASSAKMIVCVPLIMAPIVVRARARGGGRLARLRHATGHGAGLIGPSTPGGARARERGDRQAVIAATAAPESSHLGMKPRAPELSR
jgi:hypothetical protein